MRTDDLRDAGVKIRVKQPNPRKRRGSLDRVVRSYVLYDKRVKDAETGVESREPERVLRGEIGEFIMARLTRRAAH